jgi:hypothetical protein
MLKPFFFSLIPLSAPIFGYQEVQIMAKDLVFEDGLFKTDQGAVISSENFYVQAKNVSYSKKINQENPQHKVEASGDLMIIFDKRIFLAEKISYDFIEKKGVMTHGSTYDNLWFVEGKTIHLLEENTVEIQEATLTTSESQRPLYALKAQQLTLKKNDYLKAKHLQMTYLNVPVFYFPYFYTSLSHDDYSKIKYKLTWDSGQGPKFSFRYELFSSDELDLFFRFDFRTSRGLAAALESEYHHENNNIDFKTKNYLAHDTFFNDSDPNRKRTRYRLQGIFHSENEEDTFKAFFRYDKFSDPNMPLDFEGDDFELNTALKTEAIAYYTHPYVASNFYLRPKINSFQGFKQELPTIRMGFKPLNIGKSGIIFENQINLSYLNYQYNQSLEKPIPSFHSGRFEFHESFVRPIDLFFLKCTPYVGYNGVFYTLSQNGNFTSENLFIYGIDLDTTLRKQYSGFIHLLNPYAKFYTLHPVAIKPHYIFSYDDGFDPYKVLKIGAKNHLYFSKNKWDIDLFGYRFFDQNNFQSSFPKAGIEIDLDQTNLYFHSKLIYNFENKVVDFANFGLKWTLNEYIALKAEFRHRGKFGFRKVNFEDYTLDVTQNLDTLLMSPISDARNAANYAIQLNISRSTQLRYESNIGWGRGSQPSYHEFKLDIFKLIATNWKFRLSYMHLVNDDQVSFGLSLVPNP